MATGYTATGCMATGYTATGCTGTHTTTGHAAATDWFNPNWLVNSSCVSHKSIIHVSIFFFFFFKRSRTKMRIIRHV